MALDIKVKKTIELSIDIDQDGLEKLVRDHIAAEDPNINVKKVKFVPKRNPSGVAVEIEADYIDDDAAEVKADVCKGCGEVECECKPEPKEEPAPAPVEEPEETLEEDTLEEEEESESFEEQEDRLIDETLAEEEDHIDTDLGLGDDDIDDSLPDGMEDADDLVEEEPAPKRKSLFDK